MEDKSSKVIRIKKHEKNFVILDKGFLEDENLSFKAKGILTYLLSKPDNWEVSVSHLVEVSKEGKTAIYSALKELEEAGISTEVCSPKLLPDYRRQAN